ncbi:MAG TPA: flagellum-specific ATP synthase FliI, partial [Sphingomonas sp.]|nr:flagellum-specific ATP synthase FliI [Sphingomonas sp.]
MQTLASAARAIRDMAPDRRFGRVVAVRGALIEVEGLAGAAQIGSRIEITAPNGIVQAEVTALDREVALCLPFVDPQGVGLGARAELGAGQFSVRPSQAWLGRMINGLGQPVDGLGSLPNGADPQ